MRCQIEMKVPDYLHKNSYGVFYFRIAIPKYLRKVIGRKEVKKSLGTSCKATAQREALLRADSYLRFFEQKRINPSLTLPNDVNIQRDFSGGCIQPVDTAISIPGSNVEQSTVAPSTSNVVVPTQHSETTRSQSIQYFSEAAKKMVELKLINSAWTSTLIRTAPPVLT